MEPRDPKYKDSIVTVPNIICLGRAVGSLVLVALAVAGMPGWFAVLFVVLGLSDALDGYLARWLHQRSDLGARLDSFADALLYSALLFGVLLLSWDLVQHELIWLAIALGSYALTSTVGLWKFGRVPSYHTFAAKKSAWLAMFAGVALVLGWSVWPLRLAVIAVTLTNLEATAITLVVAEWRADVVSLFHVLSSQEDRS